LKNNNLWTIGIVQPQYSDLLLDLSDIVLNLD